MPQFRVYPSWHPGSRDEWVAPPSAADTRDKLHPVRTSGLNICLGTPLPRVAERDDLRCLCRNVCLECRRIDCKEHPRGSGLALAADASSVTLDVTPARLLEAMTATRKDEADCLQALLRPSLVEELDLEPSPPRLTTEVHLAERPPAEQCLFCGRATTEGDHTGCVAVDVEERDMGVALILPGAREAQRWRALRGEPPEVARLHVAALPPWQAQACRCCGRREPSAAASSPLRAEQGRKLLLFQSHSHVERWRRAHPDAPPSRAEGFALRLDAPPPWVGGCQCCGAEAAAPLPQITRHPAGDATLLFASAESLEAWRAAHSAVVELPGRVRRRRWRFGPAQLLPLLRRMDDFAGFRNLEVALFSKHHVVRSVEGCGAREANRVVQLGKNIWKLRWAQEDTHVVCVPLLHHGTGRRPLRKGEPGALQGDHVDGMGRVVAGTAVRRGDEIARYDLAGQTDSLTISLGDGEALMEVVKWEDRKLPAHLVDVVYLREVAPAHRATQRCKERLAVQRDLARLRLEAVEGRGRDPKSASEIAAGMLSGRGLARGAQGTLRAQAETCAHVFHNGPDRARVVVSSADALFMRVLRRYRASREDHLALLRGPLRYPGCLTVRWQRGEQSGALAVRRGGWNEGLDQLRASTREAKLAEWCALLEQAASQPASQSASRPAQRVQELAQLFEASGRHGLARLARASLADDDVLLRELQIERARAWCASLGVTHLVAHPVNEDCYYCVRNPFDNSGSAQCLCVKVVPGTSRGAGFSALLLERFGMDHDGDHASLVAVLDVASAEVQEASFGAEHRLFMETGRFVGGPTPWPLERWISLLEGEHLHLSRDVALAVLAGAGTATALEPPRPVRKGARHAPGTPLRLCEQVDELREGTRCVAAPPRAGQQRGEQAVVLGRAGQQGGEVVRVLPRAALWRAQVSGADLLAALLGAVLPPGYVLRLPHCGREVWRGGEQISGGACFSLQVARRAAKGWERLAWRAYESALAGAARLGQATLAETLQCSGLDLRGRGLLEAARELLRTQGPRTPRDAATLALRLRARSPALRADHEQLLASLQAAMSAPPWEHRVAELLAGTLALPRHRHLFLAGSRRVACCMRLPLAHSGNVRLACLAQALARRRWLPAPQQNALSRWPAARPMAQAAWQLPAALGLAAAWAYGLPEGAAEECGLLGGASGAPDAGLPPAPKRACTRVLRVRCPRAAQANWTRFLVCMRAARNMPSLDKPTVRDILTSVARDVGPLSALEIAAKLQTTGYLIGVAPALLARSDDPERGAQPLLEACVEAFNHLWECQPPLPFPCPAGALAQMRQRAVADPVRALFAALARGFGPTPPCGRCADCDARAQAARVPPPTKLGRRILAAATRPDALRQVIAGDGELENLLASRPPGAPAARELARFDARRGLADTLLAALQEDEHGGQ